VLGTEHAYVFSTMQTPSSSFIRALVDDASINPLFSSLLGLKRQREAAERRSLAQLDRAPLRRFEPAEQIREQAA